MTRYFRTYREVGRYIKAVWNSTKLGCELDLSGENEKGRWKVYSVGLSEEEDWAIQSLLNYGVPHSRFTPGIVCALAALKLRYPHIEC